MSRHSTEAPATVRLCRIKEKCLKTDLKCVNGWSSSTVQWKSVWKSRSSNRETTSSSVQVVRRNWQKLQVQSTETLACREVQISSALYFVLIILFLYSRGQQGLWELAVNLLQLSLSAPFMSRLHRTSTRMSSICLHASRPGHLCLSTTVIYPD